MFKKFLVLVIASFLVSPCLLAKQALAATYDIDSVHSTIGFAVRHLVVSTTRGQFNTYNGTIEYDPSNPSAFKADVTIDVGSIDTNNEKRDGHLKSADFFDVEKYPAITFKNASMEESGTVIVGDLTIKDVTKRTTIPVEISGPVQGPQGGNVIGISGEITINRQDFGVSFNKVLETGGLVVSDDVKIIVDLEAHSK